MSENEDPEGFTWDLRPGINEGDGFNFRGRGQLGDYGLYCSFLVQRG